MSFLVGTVEENFRFRKKSKAKKLPIIRMPLPHLGHRDVHEGGFGSSDSFPTFPRVQEDSRMA